MFYFSKKYSSPAIKKSEATNKIKSRGGYRSALFTSTQYSDTFYFEVQIESTTGFVRAGIATKEYEMNGPVGIDKNGYSYGSRNGYGFHNSIRKRFGERIAAGMILSIHLVKNEDGRILKFYLNGEEVGNVFAVLDDQTYWPAVSLYGKSSAVFMNFGPYFAYETKILHDELL